MVLVETDRYRLIPLFATHDQLLVVVADARMMNWRDSAVNGYNCAPEDG